MFVPPRSYTDEQLRVAVAGASCLSDVLRALGLRTAGGNHRQLHATIDRLGVSTEHFADRGWRGPRKEAKPLAEVMVAGSLYQRGLLKRRLYDAGLKPRRCELCGQGELWRGARMSLILDHINGVADDHRLENLRIVCPNCNATLDTHCAKTSGTRSSRSHARSAARVSWRVPPGNGSAAAPVASGPRAIDRRNRTAARSTARRSSSSWPRSRTRAGAARAPSTA